MALRHYLQLAMADGIGPILTRRIIEAAGSAQTACEASASLLRQVDGIGKSAQSICDSIRAAPVDLEMERAAKLGINLICPDDATYPTLLREIPDPPVVLYIKGTLEPRDLNAIAIVGSRKCSYYGREQAERFGALLAGVGVTVIS